MNFFITVWFIVGLSYRFSTTDQIVGTQKLIKMRNIDAMPLKNLIFYILIELSLLWMNLNCKKSKSTKFTLYIWFWWIIKKKNTFYHKFKISINNNDLFIKKTRFPRTCESPHWTGILNNSRGTSKFFIHCETHRG